MAYRVNDASYQNFSLNNTFFPTEKQSHHGASVPGRDRLLRQAAVRPSGPALYAAHAQRKDEEGQ